MSETWLSDSQIRNQKLGKASRTTLHRLRQDPNFPKPRRLVGRNLTPESEIDAYLQQMFAEQSARVIGEHPAAPYDRHGRFANVGDAVSSRGARKTEAQNAAGAFGHAEH